MIVAAAVNKPDIEAVIPETLEEAEGLLFIETDSSSIVRYERDEWVGAMVSEDCEAILCGQMHDAALFEKIAGACVTRYYAAGMSVESAIVAMNAYMLSIIRDYVGGPGCSGESHDTSDSSCECGCSHD